jgi:hypothetical protein
MFMIFWKNVYDRSTIFLAPHVLPGGTGTGTGVRGVWTVIQ